MQGEAGIPGMPGPKGVTVSYDKRDATFQQLTRLCAFLHFFLILSFFRVLQETGVKRELLEQGLVSSRCETHRLIPMFFSSKHNHISES